MTFRGGAGQWNSHCSVERVAKQPRAKLQQAEAAAFSALHAYKVPGSKFFISTMDWHGHQF